MSASATDVAQSHSFCGVKLTTRLKRASKTRHLFVTTRRRTIDSIKAEIVLSLKNFMDVRLGVEKASDAAEPFAVQLKALSPDVMASGTATAEDISKSCSLIAPDLDKQQFHSSYSEVVHFMRNATCRPKNLQDVLLVTLRNIDWLPLSIAVARVLAAKPHSCDVERLVSAYNLAKDDDRCSLAENTLDAYLHIHINMPVLSKFNPRPALHHWYTSKQRRVCDTPKATQQEWFRGVF